MTSQRDRLRRRHVDIHPLKEFAGKLPQGSTLKAVIMGESDQMTAQDFVAKMDTWLRVLEHDAKWR